MTWNLSFRTMRHIRDGENFLDAVYLEAVTPVRFSTPNSVFVQGEEGVTASEAGREERNPRDSVVGTSERLENP